MRAVSRPGEIAQLVEHTTENRGVPGSNPGLATPTVIPSPPAAISFDFWHTLVAEPDGLLAALRREAVVEALMEQRVTVEGDILDTYLEQAQALQAEAWERGEHFEPMRAAVQLADAIDDLEGESRSRILAAYLDAGKAADLELSPGAAETLAALADGGVQLGIVCDVGLTGSRHLRALLERTGVLCYFTGWAFSDEIGHYKPALAIFRHMLDQFGLGEGDVVWHVGDLKRTDVAGARRAGLIPIRYRGLVDDTSEAAEADLVIEHFSELIALAR
jgi:FMN phosphatase YigB (HAD superfamily)